MIGAIRRVPTAFSAPKCSNLFFLSLLTTWDLLDGSVGALVETDYWTEI